MIKELKTKVFWILMLSISVVVLGIILIFAYLNYSNTINAGTSMMDRFNNFEKIQTSNEERVQINQNNIATIDLSNTYSYIIDQGKITDNMGEKNPTVEEYAIKAYNKKREMA